MNSNLIDWLSRYLLAELAGIVGAVVGGSIVQLVASNQALVALGGVWGENLGFYTTIFLSSIIRAASTCKALNVRDAYSIVRKICVEFGVSEVVDTLVTRPLLLYAFTSMTDNVPIGLCLAKVSADVAFYSITILMYEYSKQEVPRERPTGSSVSGGGSVGSGPQSTRSNAPIEAAYPGVLSFVT